ncbi:MAG TPA: YhjD/YihY/BrkB family envelope integrity protein, partial [Burkholderiaceae bacterium]|nr:YhjD/YihY/BrkB family envelope integrity protein [Burkholderiaceae bacterium]
VAVGFEIAKRLLAWYVRAVPTYSTVYGAFATLPIFLLWIYLSWVVVLLGAVIAAYAPSLAMRVARVPDTPGYRFALSVAVLRELTRVRGTGSKGLTLDALSGAMRVDPLQVEPVLEALMGLDWVARLDEEGARRHVLLADPQTTLAAQLVDSLLLEPTPATQAFRARAAFASMKLADLF